MKKHFIALSCGFSMLTISILANNMTVGGTGGTLRPIQNNGIRMLNEHIDIDGAHLNSPYSQRAWQYQCRYQFKNMTTHHKAITMAFPFPSLTPGYHTTPPPQANHQPNGSLLYHFITTINRIPVHTAIINTGYQHPNDYELKFNKAYAFQVAFKAHEIKTIRHRFVTGVTHDPNDRLRLHYILTTGKLWNQHTIDRAVITVTPHIKTRLCSEIASSQHPSIQPAPQGLTVKGKGNKRQYHWMLTQFSPKKDLSLCLDTAESFVHNRFVVPVSGTRYNKTSPYWHKGKKALIFTLNAIEAQYGKVFSHKTTQQQFTQQWWYTPNTHYSPSRLTDLDKQAITWLQWRLKHMPQPHLKRIQEQDTP